MNIPDEAVEAAVLALAAKHDPRNEGEHGGELWNRMVADVRLTLEAAAPHLMTPAASDLEDQDDLAEILKKERWKYVAMKDEDGRPDGGYFEQSNDDVARVVIRAGFRKVHSAPITPPLHNRSNDG